MNRSKVLQVLLAVSLAIVGATKVQAVPIAGSPHMMSCHTCHSAFDTFNALTLRHNCVSCHSPGGNGGRVPFTEEAMANPFGSTPDATPKGKGTWRSHNWDSNIANTKAGSQIPVGSNIDHAKVVPYITDPVTQQKRLVCASCHRVHSYEYDLGDPAQATYVNTYLKPKLLRDRNDQDQMCNNCHQPRVSTTSVNGSHPVTINYTSAWRGKYASFAQYTQSFHRTPKNKNVANPTSQLANSYVAGKINCSTCHSTHYGDGDSSTFDNRSTANGGQYPKHSISNGMLLRTEQFGANADDLNICTNCHKDKAGSKTRAHNNKATVNQNVQCVNCHEAHVDEGDGSAPNQKLIARTLTYSSSFVNTKGRKINFTAANPYYMDANQTGVCQGCHRVPQYGEPNPRPNGNAYPQDHNKVTAVASDCNGCHPHNYGFTFDDQNVCNSCHGYPPPPKAPQLGNYTSVNESFTPHRVHAGGIAKPIPDLSKYGYQCEECHYSGLNSVHKNGDAQNLFVTPGPIASSNGANPSYDKLNRTCNNVYCHSDAGPGGAATTYKVTPSWKNGLGAFNASKCSQCHGDAASLTTGAHRKHVAGGYECKQCHKDTASSNTTIVSKTLHANANKDLTFLNAGSTFTKNGTGDVNCTNSCHVAGLAWWKQPATGACGTCHLTSPQISTYSPGTINSNAHTAHLSVVSGPQFGTVVSSCQVCHTTFSTASPHLNGTAVYAVAKCNACHPTANGTVVWSQPASVTCRSCHVGVASFVQFSTTRKVSVTAPLMNNFTTQGHGTSFGSIGSTSGTIGKVDCDGCHDASTPHIKPAVATKRLTGVEKDICANCHNQNWSKNSVVRTKLVTKTHVVVEGESVPSAACSACHDPHGTGNKRMIRSSIVFNVQSAAAIISFTNPSTGFVQMTPPYRGLCQICHTKTNHFRRGLAEINGHEDAGHRRCLECHDHQPLDSVGQMAFAPNGDCDGCHGYPPAKSMTGLGLHNNYSSARIQDYVGGGGFHTVAGHVGPDASVKNKANANCSNCHYQFPVGHNSNGSTVNRSNMKIQLNPALKFNNAFPVQYDKTSQTCSNVNCHYSVTPKWQ